MDNGHLSYYKNHEEKSPRYILTLKNCAVRDEGSKPNKRHIAKKSSSSVSAPTSTLDVRGEVRIGTAVQLGSAGVVTATSFSGSGSNLTGLATTETVRTDTLTVAISACLSAPAGV